MQWVRVFADLESRFSAHEYSDIAAEAYQIAVAEQGQSSWLMRLTPEREVTVRTAFETVTGVVKSVAASWILLTAHSGDYLIPTVAVLQVSGLNMPNSALSPVQMKLSMAHVLREVARLGTPIAIVNRAGDVARGQLSWVGNDHLDLGNVTLTYSAIDCVRLGK